MNFFKHLKSKFTGKIPDSQGHQHKVGRTTRACCVASETRRAAANAPNISPVSPIRPIPTASTSDVVGTRSCASETSSPTSEDEAQPLNDNNAGPTASPSPGGEGRGEGELNFFNTDFSPDNRNGKIARLPREWRERINQAFYRRCPAVQIVRALNKEPEVKAAMAEHFQGRPVNAQNLTEWKQGGYRDWLSRRQILEQQRELTADAKDLSDAANGMADSLFGMLTLDYARLMMNRDSDTPEEFEKKRKALGILAQDIVRLRRCHLNARRVEIQETRLENDQEKTDEQVFAKFAEWAENPAVRRACILEPMQRNRVMRRQFDIPPTPEDIWLEKEIQNDPYFRPSTENQTDIKPPQTEKTEPKSRPDSRSSPALRGASAQTKEPEPLPSPERTPETSVGTRCAASESAADPQVSPTTVPAGSEGELNNQSTNPTPANPYAGKTTQQVIAEIEENYARKTAARHNDPSRRTGVPPVSDPTSLPSHSPAAKDPNISPIGPISPIHTTSTSTQAEGELSNSGPQSAPANPQLSDYEKAILEGKSSLEAMYAQSTRPKDPPPVRQPRPLEPPPYYAISRQPDPPLQRPPPEWNSLG